MPGISRQTAAHHDDHGPVLDIHEDLGDLSVNFLTVKIDIDGAPLLKGLPDARCSCPHWGYVQFSPAEELHKISAVMQRDTKAMMQQA